MLNKTSKLVVMALFAIGLAGCANSDFSHEYLMSGQVVSTDNDSGLTVCVGEANGAEVGQVLTAYRIVSTGATSEGGSAYKKVDIGKVKISKLVDDHFAKVIVLNGDIKKNDMVQLNN
tara:strand:+ start:440 stop:793 length:354 start_codon:yes stop_codon:yes gene_type:complete